MRQSALHVPRCDWIAQAHTTQDPPRSRMEMVKKTYIHTISHYIWFNMRSASLYKCAARTFLVYWRKLCKSAILCAIWPLGRHTALARHYWKRLYIYSRCTSDITHWSKSSQRYILPWSLAANSVGKEPTHSLADWKRNSPRRWRKKYTQRCCMRRR